MVEPRLGPKIGSSNTYWVQNPHVFILGAGASRAAFPNGDRNGRLLPLMDDLPDVLGMKESLKSLMGDHQATGFEELYSKLASSESHANERKRLEVAIRDYFTQLELPDQPTLYDFLLLALRPKDMIATFDWDPLLWQASQRCAKRFGESVLPLQAYLHGNVAVGYCHNHLPVTLGQEGSICNTCRCPLRSSRLLFPFNKNYRDDPSIAASWNQLSRGMANAMLLTIFGYSGPASDFEARKLLDSAWNSPGQRDSEDIEIIDIRTKQILEDTWRAFICRDHYRIGADYYDSYAAAFPRRSCECFFDAHAQNNPHDHSPIPCTTSWKELENSLRPLIEEEKRSQ